MKYIKTIFFTAIALFVIGCEQEDSSAPGVMVHISEFNIKHNAGKHYVLEASVPDVALGRIAECGFYVSENINFQNLEKITSKVAGNTFYGEIVLPEYNTDYYVCAFISNGKNEMCSNMEKVPVGALDEFVTFEGTPMTNYNSSANRMAVAVSYSIAEGVVVDECGLYYSFVEEVDTSNTQKCIKGDPNTSGVVNAEIPQVELGQKLYIKVYVKDGNHIAFSDRLVLVSSVVPTVETSKVVNITDITASVEYEVSDDGGAEILSSGVVFGTMSEPTIDNASKAEGDNLGAVTLRGLDPNTLYYVRAYATNEAGTSYGNVLSFQTEKANAIDLAGPANSYIVSKAGTYRYDAVKGNSQESVGEISSVEVVWETFGTAVAPAVGDLIKNVEYIDGYIVFETADTYQEGNALIAAKNSDGTILWSWHIWMTDQPIDIYYRNVETPMMDRNLGAVSATPGDVGALGLLYQWGRKDPFLGGTTIGGEDNIRASSTYTWPDVELSTQSRGTIEYATAHPTTFIVGNSLTRDWYYPVDGVTDSTRWASEKSIYDPCPAGYRVPDGGENSVWTLAGFPEGSVIDGITESVYTYDSTNHGMTFGEPYCSPATWYPSTGWIVLGTGEYYSYEDSSYYAACYVSWGALASGLNFNYSGYVGCQHYGIYSGSGCPVRCIKESK